MKEIDFLPEWYKSGKRRQISYRTQYVALGGVFVMMVVWNFIAAHSVSKARAELARLGSKVAAAESTSQEFGRIKSQVAELQKKANILEEIDSRIDVTNVLAEISFLIDERIVLSKVEFCAEEFVDERGVGVNSGSPRLVAGRRTRAKFGKEGALSFGDVRFRVLISGVAADASNVAELICSLEDSPYFCQVTPSFSRNREIKAGTDRAGRNYHVSEFEINCYLANYRQEEPYFVKDAQSKG